MPSDAWRRVQASKAPYGTEEYAAAGQIIIPLISIVDDDALARDGIRELVESLGYKTTTFESAEHFLQSSMLDH
jgi:hypothetical protein